MEIEDINDEIRDEQYLKGLFKEDEIKEILEDNGELMVRHKDNSFECFDTLPKNVVDYITNLQEERDKFKSRNEKAIKMVKENLMGIGYVEVSKLLNILNGGER